MYGTRVHAGPEAQIHRDKKNTKTREGEIQSQGHKTLMYGTRVHAGPEAQIQGGKKTPNHEKQESSPKDTKP
jgi:hypothetical protein